MKHTHPCNLSEGDVFMYSLLFVIVTELDESLSFWHPLYIDGIWWQHLALLICNSGYTELHSLSSCQQNFSWILLCSWKPPMTAHQDRCALQAQWNSFSGWQSSTKIMSYSHLYQSSAKGTSIAPIYKLVILTWP